MPSPKSPQDHKKTTSKYGKGLKDKLSDLELPSGVIVQVKKPGIQRLLSLGLLDNLDSLTGIVITDTIATAEGTPKINPQDFIKDPKKLNDMMDIVDKLVMYVVVQPPLFKPVKVVDGAEVLLEDDERDEETFYIDDIDFEDKAFIMDAVIDTGKSLGDFRPGSSSDVGGVPAVVEAPNPA